MTNISRETIETAYQEGLDAVVTLIELIIKEQSKQIEALGESIKELENQKAKNSKNSHKPPSGDGFRKQTKSLRKKSEKKSGGQEGHKGQNLEWVEHADKIIKHPILVCQGCSQDLEELIGEKVESRQVHELPKIKLQVIEHQIEKKVCPHCQLANISQFPPLVEDWVQYGENVKGLVTYLNQYQLIPLQRTQEIMKDVFDCGISEGTIHKQGQKCYEVLAPVEQRIKEKLLEAKVMHFDETGTRVKGCNYWLHVSSTKTHTYYRVHRKRGRVAMDEMGILPNYRGKAIHDGYKSYTQYPCHHYLCNAHHLRELVFIYEQFNQLWAEEMITFLCAVNNLVKQAKLDGKLALELSVIKGLELEFQAIIDHAHKSNPIVEPTNIRTRGRPKQTKPLNLIHRLDVQRQQVLGFMYDFDIPFDNNLAERDIRMTKVKQKISGSFRTEEGANIFARIRGYISTLKKQALNVLDALTSAFRGNPLFV